MAAAMTADQCLRGSRYSINSRKQPRTTLDPTVAVIDHPDAQGGYKRTCSPALPPMLSISSAAATGGRRRLAAKASKAPAVGAGPVPGPGCERRMQSPRSRRDVPETGRARGFHADRLEHRHRPVPRCHAHPLPGRRSQAAPDREGKEGGLYTKVPMTGLHVPPSPLACAVEAANSHYQAATT